MTKYSVIIPTYNRARFINRAIRSVANQHCIEPSDIEIVVVDDGSTDNTQDVVTSIDVRPCNLRYIKLTHCGQPGTTRNVGLDKAAGQFIAYCDSDDFWFPNHLATVQVEFEKRPELMMVSTYWGMAHFVIHPEGWIENKYVVPPHPTYAVNTNCRVHARGCIDGANGFRFNASRWGEDQDFFNRIEHNFPSKKVLVVTNVCGYIQGGNNLTYNFDNNIKSRYY